MNILKIPFNEFVGLQTASEPEYLLALDARTEYLNHLGTIHASALFALAEASSGVFLLRVFEGVDNVIPVVRNAEVKYKKPASGIIRSMASLVGTEVAEILEKLQNKRRALIPVNVSLLDSQAVIVMQATFEWFVVNNTH